MSFPLPQLTIYASLTTFIGIDQVQLLLQNAKQMLKIVKAAFTDVLFVAEERVAGEHTKSSHAIAGDGQKLADLWARAALRLPVKDSMDSEAYEALEALYRVRN